MEFRLVFDGDLRPRKRSNLQDIHQIRMTIHPQMEALWQHEPLSDLPAWQDEQNPSNLSARTVIDEQVFISIVSKGLFIQAELDILLLRAQPPGMLVSNVGDIDNRIKTLFDGLRVPTKSEVNNLRASGAMTKQKIFCLMEDDNLISKLSVSTDRLLGESKDTNRTLAIINVKLRPTRVTMGNLALIA
ncbi:hypothetical protein Rleg5DRAFT_5050 [Rhizobium leguminosarum bv. viciae WSM1455]|uniref:hypothetical protein n=1 Tax=Rhizobium acaciae TaxID=2989736 RepID=UPI00027D74AD|nr:hypothetical protein [Rhizobium acaciae]EJC69264.1 hypothetical protein Rleg5DRAFT_5050 [Rhizobium leguminosarum bv. viciae WSM1455]MCW1754489.1 hypothetical protein [Rhizobium acaciae]